MRTTTDRRRAHALIALCLVLCPLLVSCEADSGVRARQAAQVTVPDDAAPVRSATPTTAASSTSTTDVEMTLPPTTVPPTSTTFPTETIATAPPPTDPPATEPPATEPPATPPPPRVVPAGWTYGAPPAGALDGCCAPMWRGVPSPPFPEDPAAGLDDGLYSATVAAPWDPAAPDLLTVEVRRRERCSVLGAAVCVHPGPYGDADVSTALEPVRTFTVRLNDNIAVVLSGFDVCAAAVKTGNGTDMAALLQAFATAYTDVIGTPLTTGSPPDAVLSGLAAAPAGGFSVADPTCMSGVAQFRAGSAPPLLLASLTGPADDGSPLLTPTEVIRLVSVDQHQGLTTLSFHAGHLP